MSDIPSGMPVRTEADGTDERLHAKLVDGAVPAQMMTVDTDLNAHVETHGNDPAGVDRVIRTSELGALTPDGVYDAADNTKPGNLALIVHERNAAPGDAQSTIRATGINSSVNTGVWAQDVAIRDENGNPFTAANPLPVTNVDSEGTEVNDYNTASLAAAASGNHDYTVTALMTLKLSAIWGSASGKLKIEVQIETAAASGTFVTRFVGFNSTANPNIDLPIKENISVVAGARVRVIRTNLDNQPQSVYTTISGHEIT
jgi:hypothetical protein